jgi:hypothetical protein
MLEKERPKRNNWGPTQVIDSISIAIEIRKGSG